MPNTKYLLGFNKNQKKKTLPKNRCPYTITEILQIMDFAERQKKDHPEQNVVKSVKFWRAVEKKNMIPD